MWFESLDLSLKDSVEAIGSAFLIPAAAAGRQLKFATSPEDVWLNNARQAQRVAAEWWGFDCPIKAASSPTAPNPTAAVTRNTALCFTGGVDSFYSLLRGNHSISHLVYVHGYDTELADSRRAQTIEASLRSVAEERNLQAVTVRTNLRAHRAFRKAKWEQSHGGALAAVGHLLSDYIAQLLISASYPKAFDRPWGSHWALDPWWSSSRLTVTHVGAEKWRAEKLVAIMDEPLVRQHLRVCWENRSLTGNCGQCEKCLRTMLVLDGHGCLEAFPVFPGAATVAANLEQLEPLRNDLIRVYAGFLDLNLSSNVRSSLAALVERSIRAADGLTGSSSGTTVPKTHWDGDTLRMRIANPGTRQRYAGGSPDQNETAAYREGFAGRHTATALVLGMTPELRNLALANFRKLISVDSNSHSIALYQDWISIENRTRETIIEADWFSLPTRINTRVNAVLADGVFGNLADYTAHAGLLRVIAEVLTRNGRFVTRMAIIPDGFDASQHCADRLLERFRAGQIDEAEFGFGMRLVGHYESCYDSKPALLDNAKLFAHCASRHAAGELTDAEHAAIRRYYFGSFNCILSQRQWEQLLADGGWAFRVHRCHGKTWYDYYPVYSCWQNR